MDRVRRGDHAVTFAQQSIAQRHQDDFFIVHNEYRVAGFFQYVRLG
jgi:hypothetical protein